MDYYLTIKMIDILIRATTLMNLENLMPRERRQG